MRTKQLLKSKWNLYWIHFLFLSRDSASLAPHSSKFHASPLNPAYRKCSLSFYIFLPVASRWVFKTQIKGTACLKEKKMNCPASLSPCMCSWAWFIPHIIFILSGREVGKCLLAHWVLAGTPVPPLCTTEKTKPGMFSWWILFLSFCCYEKQHFGSDIWRSGSKGHSLLPCSGICVSGIYEAGICHKTWRTFETITRFHLKSPKMVPKLGGKPADRQTDILHSTTSTTKRENPGRSVMDQRRKPPRQQLLFKLSRRHN